MPIKFEFYTIPDPEEEGKVIHHARPIINRTVKTPEIARKIQSASSLTIGDVKAVLSALTDIIAENLEDSNRVHLEGIGFFEPTLKATREIDPLKTRAQSVWFKAVSYRADKILKSRLVGAMTERSSLKIHSTILTDEEVDEKVRIYFVDNQFLNTQRLRYLCGFTRYAATKHIKRMLQEGKIRNVYTNKNPMYVKENP